MADHKIFPHGEPTQHADELWQVRGSLSFPLPRYMTVVRLPSGGLMIYSAVAMDDAGMEKLEALGKPEALVAPHIYHCMDAGFYKQRYPDIQLIAPPIVKDKLATMGVAADEGVGAIAEHGLRYAMVAGSKCAEVMLDLDTSAGRALVFTDCVSPRKKRGFLMGLMGPPEPFGVPRIVRFRQIDDKPALARFLTQMGEGNVDMLVLGHAAPVTENCGGMLRIAASKL